MSKNEFLKELRDYLTGSVSAAEVEESIAYYEKYISDQIKSGQSEDEVLGALGDPRIIGRSIADAAGRRGAAGSGSRRDHGRRGQGNTGSGFSGNGNSGAGSQGGAGEPSGRWSRSRLKLYGTLALVLLVVLVVLIAITKVIAFFFPLIVVIIVLTMVFRNSGGRR